MFDTLWSPYIHGGIIREGDLHFWGALHVPDTGLYVFYAFNHYTNDVLYIFLLLCHRKKIIIQAQGI